MKFFFFKKRSYPKFSQLFHFSVDLPGRFLSRRLYEDWDKVALGIDSHLLLFFDFSLAFFFSSKVDLSFLTEDGGKGAEENDVLGEVKGGFIYGS